MNREILKQKEMLVKLNIEINDLKRLLDGKYPVENEGDFKEECVLDIINNNSMFIEIALKNLDQINQILNGEK